MPLWIPITIFAALCQNIRTTMQQKIRGVLSVDGALTHPGAKKESNVFADI